MTTSKSHTNLDIINFGTNKVSIQKFFAIKLISEIMNLDHYGSGCRIISVPHDPLRDLHRVVDHPKEVFTLLITTGGLHYLRGLCSMKVPGIP
jgi:hypothetical protein